MQRRGDLGTYTVQLAQETEQRQLVGWDGEPSLVGLREDDRVGPERKLHAAVLLMRPGALGLRRLTPPCPTARCC